jgi:hypothetical protein
MDLPSRIESPSSHSVSFRHISIAITARERVFPLRHCVQTDSQLIPSRTKVKNAWRYTSIRHASSQRGTSLSTGTT